MFCLIFSGLYGLLVSVSILSSGRSKFSCLFSSPLGFQQELNTKSNLLYVLKAIMWNTSIQKWYCCKTITWLWIRKEKKTNFFTEEACLQVIETHVLIKLPTACSLIFSELEYETLTIHDRFMLTPVCEALNDIWS